MKIPKDLMDKFQTFLIEELLFNSNSQQLLLKKDNKKLNFNLDDDISTLFLIESEYDNLIDKMIFTMNNKYLNINYYDDLYQIELDNYLNNNKVKTTENIELKKLEI